MMTFNITTLIFMILELTNCMKIYEEIIFSRYCPRNNTCDPPGTHIVCKLFRTQTHRQPNCLHHNPADLTPMHANLILQRTNKLRAEVASGAAIGLNGLLPRAFGMYRVNWDAELASMSELLLRNGDYGSFFGCAATGAFPTPGIASWTLPADSTSLEHFIENAFDFSDTLKRDVTEEDILNCPDLKEHDARYYIRVIQGGATHMGCAIAECTDKSDSSKVHRLYCYFSTWTPNFEPVYNTDPPIPDTGFSPNCGCPPGFLETAGCLCGDTMEVATSMFTTEVATSMFTTEAVTSTFTTEMGTTTSTAMYPNVVYKTGQVTAPSTAAVEESYMHIDLTVV